MNELWLFPKISCFSLFQIQNSNKCDIPEKSGVTNISESCDISCHPSCFQHEGDLKCYKPFDHSFRAATWLVLQDQKSTLTHWGWVTHMRQWTYDHWFRYWLVAWMAPSHFMNQWWTIVNLTLRNKLQWNTNRKLHIFIKENAFENVVCQSGSHLARPQCFKRILVCIYTWTQ